MLGPERPLLLSHDDRQRIAYHESGHAILGLVVPGADPVQRVTIVPRGQALGVTYQRPQTDRYNYPEAYLRARIVGMLGGRAAEEIVYGTRTTGAESDIEQATQLARNMVTRWGMSDKLGMVQLAPKDNPYLGGATGFVGEKPFGERTAEIIDAEVQRIIGESHTQAKDLLVRHRRSERAGGSAPRARDARRARDPRATGLSPAPPLRDRLLASMQAAPGRRLDRPRCSRCADGMRLNRRAARPRTRRPSRSRRAVSRTDLVRARGRRCPGQRAGQGRRRPTARDRDQGAAAGEQRPCEPARALHARSRARGRAEEAVARADEAQVSTPAATCAGRREQAEPRLRPAAASPTASLIANASAPPTGRSAARAGAAGADVRPDQRNHRRAEAEHERDQQVFESCAGAVPATASGPPCAPTSAVVSATVSEVCSVLIAPTAPTRRMS